MNATSYLGWTYLYDQRQPETGRWKAWRFGVGMCAGTEAALRRMIEVRYAEAVQRRGLT